MRAVVLTMMLVACAVKAQSQTPVVLTDATAGQTVTSVSHFRTTDARLDIVGVAHQSFTPLDSTRSINLGYDRGNHWFRFDLVNRSSRNDWFFEIGSSPLDHVEFYARDERGNWSLQFSGDLYKMSTRVVKHRNFVFPFFLKHDTKETFYLKVLSTSSLQIPLTVWSPDGLRNNVYETQFAHGIFYGIMLIMVFYNLFLYISIRDKTVLYYVFTLLAGTNVIAYFHGYGFYYVNPEFPELNLFAAAFASPLFIVSSVALTRSFLALKQINFWLDRALLAVAVVAVIFALLTIGLGAYISYVPMRLLALLNFSLILTAAIYGLFKKYRPARYFLLAWATLLVLGLGILLRNIGVINNNWFLGNALYIGGIMQTLLISFALGDRINALQKENLLVKERELLREQEEKVRLEREVALRTEEIRQKNSQLQESNDIKSKLFSLVSHDLRGPLVALQGVLQIAEMDALTPEQLKVYTEKIGMRLHYTSELLDNLLQWSRLQMKGEKFTPITVKFSVRELLLSGTQVLKAECEKKGIRLMVDVPGEYMAKADINMVKTVVRNLVSNALKFTHPGGKIVLNATRKDSMIAVSVSDSGIGITEQNIATLFTLHGVTTPGTLQEKGTGIGLVVCKEFVERNGGTISVTSVVGNGTTFEFTLPQVV